MERAERTAMYETEDGSLPGGEESSGSSGSVRWGVRSRLLGAFLVVALMTVGVGIFGIQRMSVLSDQAEQVYADGAVPLGALKQLQVDWWYLSAETARSNIPTLPADTTATAQQGAAAGGQTL